MKNIIALIALCSLTVACSEEPPNCDKELSEAVDARPVYLLTGDEVYINAKTKALNDCTARIEEYTKNRYR